VCVDVVPDKVAMLRSGRLPIYEHGLEELVRTTCAAGRLDFALGAAGAVEDAEFLFLCVQTPQGADGSADLTYIEEASHQIGPLLRPGCIVITKSTVPVGSTEIVERALGRTDVCVVSNPEFLREGTAVHDCLHPDRIVIGSRSRVAAARVADLYKDIAAPVIVTDPATAETIKYACNAFLATKVSFINAVANLCEAVGADVHDLARAMGYDKRIGFDFLEPGPGWGGSCFPKDTRALIKVADDHGYDFGLLRGVVAVNDEQFERVVDRVERQAGGTLAGAAVAVWGLTFKAGTDDLRDSPSTEVIRRLLARGATVSAYDPTEPSPTSPHLAGMDVRVASDPYAACEGASVVVVLTEWDEFRWLDFGKVGELVARPAIVDARNILDPIGLRRLGFSYVGMGRL
jgi:UDPglucose 6-dehydrogenase